MNNISDLTLVSLDSILCMPDIFFLVFLSESVEK